MDVTGRHGPLIALAAFVRARLADVGAAIGRTSGVTRGPAPDSVRTAIVAAAPPFAPTSYARARLLRQLHASGLSSRHEAQQAIDAMREVS